MIGSAIVEELNDHGYRTANLDRHRPDDEPADEFRRTDLLAAGQTYGSLARCDADAVVHMGTSPIRATTRGTSRTRAT